MGKETLVLSFGNRLAGALLAWCIALPHKDGIVKRHPSSVRVINYSSKSETMPTTMTKLLYRERKSGIMQENCMTSSQLDNIPG